jgi:hypothetical protein
VNQLIANGGERHLFASVLLRRLRKLLSETANADTPLIAFQAKGYSLRSAPRLPSTRAISALRLYNTPCQCCLPSYYSFFSGFEHIEYSREAERKVHKYIDENLLLSLFSLSLEMSWKKRKRWNHSPSLINFELLESWYEWERHIGFGGTFDDPQPNRPYDLHQDTPRAHLVAAGPSMTRRPTSLPQRK